MKHIIEAFGSIVVMMLSMFLCIGVCNVCGIVAEAKELKADIIAEIENSNFNPKVIDACKMQAESMGYEVQITNCVYDDRQDIQSAEVILHYSYRMPLLGIEEMRATRGIAR